MKTGQQRRDGGLKGLFQRQGGSVPGNVRRRQAAAEAHTAPRAAEREEATVERRLRIEAYLEKVSRFAGDGYGRQVRTRFADDAGFAELAMLGSPSIEELEQLRRAVAIMTPREKAGPPHC